MTQRTRCSSFTPESPLRIVGDRDEDVDLDERNGEASSPRHRTEDDTTPQQSCKVLPLLRLDQGSDIDESLDAQEHEDASDIHRARHTSGRREVNENA